MLHTRVTSGMTASEIEAFVDAEFAEARALGWQLVSVGGRAACLKLVVEKRHLRPGPSVSGPTLMALADIATYFAVLGEIGLQPLAVTTSLDMHFMRRFGAGALLAEATLLKVGKRLIVGQVHIVPEAGGDPIATATLTYSVPPRT